MRRQAREAQETVSCTGAEWHRTRSRPLRWRHRDRARAGTWQWHHQWRRHDVAPGWWSRRRRRVHQPWHARRPCGLVEAAAQPPLQEVLAGAWAVRYRIETEASLR